MHQYELMIIIDPDIDERTVAPSLEKFLNVITNGGGTIEETDIWGRRKLAYEINKKSEGFYVVVNFTANADVAKELDRQLGISEAVMRTKLLRAEEAVARVAKAKEESAKKAERAAAAQSSAGAAQVAAAGTPTE